MELLLSLFIFFQENSKWDIDAKDILFALSGLAGLVLSYFSFFLGRKDNKKNKDLENENTIIGRYKDDRDQYKKDYDTLMDKYEELYTNKMAIQVELAVIAYEHELLYNKLTKEEATLVRQRVDMFKNSLIEMTVKDKKVREEKIQEIKEERKIPENETPK